jgi:large subunit ribosomal protein L25
MATRATLTAAPRSILGKQVKRLRQQGLLPANVYGRGLESLALQLDAREFLRTVRAAGVRSMFELKVEGESQPRYVLIRALQRKGGTGDPIHVDFYQVDLNRPILTNVPLRVVGEAPAVRDLAGTLLVAIESVTVRCRPLDLPEAIEVDVSKLASFDATITVGDLTPPPGVEVVTEPSTLVATVSPPRLRLGGETPAADGAEGAEAAEE